MKIKVVFWDLDNTLWDGILSEGPVPLFNGRAKTVKYLNKNGIINSICSLNDFNTAKELLEDLGLWGEFVFPSISYGAKSAQIKAALEAMHLRAENALFIDDTDLQLEEVKFHLPDINTLKAEQGVALKVRKLVEDSIKPDPERTRLKQYKVLEEKAYIREIDYEDDDSFLRASDIRISYVNPLRHLDRIHELVSRTNNLNYTKRRDTKKELRVLLGNNTYTCRGIAVVDKYGDYGIAGFVAYGKDVRHFLFSCRVMNMGIQDYVWNALKLPAITPELPVACEIGTKCPDWIRVAHYVPVTRQSTSKKTLFVGGCDIQQMGMLLGGNYDMLTNYPSQQHRLVTIHPDSVDTLLSRGLSREQKQFIATTCPFLDMKSFRLPRFKDYGTIVFSALGDYSKGAYTSSDIPGYISCHGFKKHNPLSPEWCARIAKQKQIPRADVDRFAKHWTFVEKPDDYYMDQLRQLFDKFRHAKVAVLLGATNTYSNMDDDFFEIHQSMNIMVESVARDYSNIILVWPDDYIKSRADFNDSIRHYKKHIYHKMAKAITAKV